MSQVYANSTDKYWAMTGFNQYTLTPSTNQSIPASAFRVVAFTTTVNISKDTSQMSLSSNNLVFATSGVYSVNYQISVESSVSGATDLDWAVTLTVIGLNAATLSILAQSQRKDPGYSSGSGTRIVTLSYIGYFGAGDEIQCGISNNDTMNIIAVNANETQIIASRIY